MGHTIIVEGTMGFDVRFVFLHLWRPWRRRFRNGRTPAESEQAVGNNVLFSSVKDQVVPYSLFVTACHHVTVVVRSVLS